MSGSSGKAREIDLGDDFGEVIVRANGMNVQIHADGRVETYTFNEAAKYAKNINAYGPSDFHVPSKGELNVLWENRNQGKLAGTFNETGSFPAGWYWSSSPYDTDLGWAQRFSDGGQVNYFRDNVSSLRCVRYTTMPSG